MLRTEEVGSVFCSFILLFIDVFIFSLDSFNVICIIHYRIKDRDFVDNY